MGADVHFYVERKNDSGIWVTADAWETETGEDFPDRLYVPYPKAFYRDRNYDLFAILANVRNGYGFAGVPTGRGFVPISMPRGIPEDACPEYQQAAKYYGSDGHSHSYLTVEEIIAYDWTQTTQLQGVVDAKTFEQWNRYARVQGHGPESYAGAVGGRDVKQVSEEEMTELIKPYGRARTIEEEKQELEKLKHVYCLVKWEQHYYQCATEFLSQTLPRLWRLGKPADVRCVFFFDN